MTEMLTTPEAAVPERSTLPPLPPASPVLKLLTSTRLRRITPLWLALGVARAINAYRWRSAEYREWCARSMHFLLDASPRAADADRLARRFGYWTLKRSELIWHPHRLATVPVSGIARLERALTTGRGVVISFTHQGWFAGAFPSIRSNGVTIHVPIADFFLTAANPGYRGRHDRQHLLNASLSGEILGAAGSWPKIQRFLAAGEAVALAFDVRGSRPTTVLGRTVYAANGAARCAMSTGALIVPLTMRNVGRLGEVRLEEPLDPNDYDSVDELHAAIVARHEPALLAWPEAVEWPLLRWTEDPPQPAATA